MGMKQKRCPRCKKQRRWAEGGGENARARWTKVNGRWICPICEPIADPVIGTEEDEMGRKRERGTDGKPSGRLEGQRAIVKQCKSCPWRVDCVPDKDIPNYVPELARGLDCTIAKGPMQSLATYNAGAMRMMACHYSEPGEEFPCAGWLENQLGVGNNIGVRLLVSTGRLPSPVTDGEQHERYEDTLPCDMDR